MGETVVYSAKLHWIIYMTAKAILTLWIAPFIQRATSEFAITTKRVIIKEGLIARRTLEMNLSKIETVNVDQSITGRILNYGSITIIGTGGTHEVFHNIAHPMQFRKAFQEIDIA
ncbi:MAG: PH domain-containing protein [Deltaproteobacteria bacterium]